MFEPLRATVKLVVAAAPVPSLMITLSPTAGEAGNVKVMLPAAATQYCPSTRVAGVEVWTSAVAGKAIDCRAALTVVAFVPPLATASVPARVNVPAVVIGPPAVVSPVAPPDIATLETEPVEEATYSKAEPPEFTARTCPADPRAERFVPPLATGNMPVICEVKLTPVSAPPRTKLPVVVTVPVREMPLTVPVPPTETTVPVEPPVEAI